MGTDALERQVSDWLIALLTTGALLEAAFKTIWKMKGWRAQIFSLGLIHVKPLYWRRMVQVPTRVDAKCLDPISLQQKMLLQVHFVERCKHFGGAESQPVWRYSHPLGQLTWPWVVECVVWYLHYLKDRPKMYHKGPITRETGILRQQLDCERSRRGRSLLSFHTKSAWTISTWKCQKPKCAQYRVNEVFAIAAEMIVWLGHFMPPERKSMKNNTKLYSPECYTPEAQLFSVEFAFWFSCNLQT